MKRAAWIVGLLLVVAVLAGGGLWAWRDAAENAALTRTLAAAERATDGARWAEARTLLAEQARRRGRPEDAAAAKRWAQIEFRAAAGLRDFTALEALAAEAPGLIAEDEDAALWLWRIRRADGDRAGAERVRAVWRGREEHPVFWACAEFDALLYERARADARAVLEALPADRSDVVAVWLRRALVADDAASRFQAMTEAYRVDPADADLRALRAGLLERIGQIGYARVDYVAALVADPTNPLRRDELAAFYLRQGDFGAAVDTWAEGLDERSPDFLWLRAVFWGRVLGRAVPEAANRLPEGRKKRFAGWLASLPEGVYWDEAGYAALNLSGAHADREPVVAWSRVLEAGRTGDLEAAALLLARAPGPARELAPVLHAALRATLAVRAGMEPGRTGIGWPIPASGAHRWWSVAGAALAGEAAPAAEFAEVARGPLAVSAAFLAAGWTGPALALADPVAAAAPATPGWLRYGLLQARRQARGPADALAWGETLPPYPETDYVVASLRLAAGREDEAVPVLRVLAGGAGDTGHAAGWLLSTWLLERGSTAEARAVIDGAPALKESAEGVGLRARIALAEGRAAEAVELFRPWAETSAEAGAYLARVAFAAGDLATARRLTEFWAERMPDNLQLRANLVALTEAERAATGEATAAPVGGRP